MKPSDLERRRRDHRAGPRATSTRPTHRRCSSTTASDQDFKPRPGREDWTVDDIVAYSKLCTHVGCPVGPLPGRDAALLLCPCHQSTFDVLDGARPIFGPAARLAAAAAARRRRRRRAHRPRRLLRPGRARLLGPGPVTTDADAASRRAADAAAGPLARPAPRRGRLRPHRAQQGLPRPLVVHARRARPVLLRRPRRSPASYLTFFFHAEPERRRLPRAATRRCGACTMSRGLPVGASTSASTCGPGSSCARSTTGPRCCSSPRSSCTCAASSSPARSAGRARSTG